jgi:hypothetical protein
MDCEGYQIVGITAAVMNETSGAFYVPGDNIWVEGRTFAAWDNNQVVVQIDDDEGYYSRQEAYIIAFVTLEVC